MSFIGKSPKANRLRLQPLSVDPVSPAEGDLQFADGSAREKGLWSYKAGQWTQVSQPVDNYVLNPNIENGTANYTLFNTTISSFLPTGSVSPGAAYTLTATGVNPLQGSASLQLACSGAISSGQGFITDVFALRREDLGQKLQIEFSYEVVSGASNAQWSSGLGAQTFIVYLYDNTSSSWLQPLGFLGLNTFNTNGKFVASFRASSVANQSYRLAVLNSLPTAGAVTINFDSFSVAAQAPDLDINLVAKNSSGQLIPPGVWTDINSTWASIKDSSNSFNTANGEFTTSVYGSYLVTGSVAYTSNVAGERGIRVLQNGTPVQEILFQASQAGTTAMPFSCIVSSTLKDVIKLATIQTSGASVSLVPNVVYNVLNIVRVGD